MFLLDGWEPVSFGAGRCRAQGGLFLLCFCFYSPASFRFSQPWLFLVLKGQGSGLSEHLGVVNLGLVCEDMPRLTAV
jgi:hypothetical protein